MHDELTEQQVTDYRTNGFLVVADLLDADELAHWRSVVDAAVARRDGARFARQTQLAGEIDDSDDGGDFYSRVFDQLVNLWQDDPDVASLILDPRIGAMAATLSGHDGMRLWHDQALIKRPYANPTAFHLDVPYWSFTTRDAITIWSRSTTPPRPTAVSTSFRGRTSRPRSTT